MAAKKSVGKRGTEMRFRAPSDFMGGLRKFRAKRVMENSPITSDAKALLYLATKQLKVEGVI